MKPNETADYSSKADLSDHVRRKNRLIAPWNKVMNTTEMQISSWHLSRLPELIWIGELIHGMGPKESLEALNEFVHAAYEVRTEDEKTCPFLATYWDSVATDRNRELVVKNLKKSALLESVESTLSGFLSLYPSYPLRFVSSHRVEITEGLITEFSERVRGYISRFSVESVRIHSHIMLSEIKSGHLQVPQGFPFPDFELIYSSTADRESESFKDAAGLIRACVGSLFAFFDARNLTTGRYFWNRGLELSNCQGVYE